MTCEKCGMVLKTGMRFCPSCGEPVCGDERSSEDKVVSLLRQLKKEKKYDEIVRFALTGNAYAEYLYLDHAIEKAKTWTQSAQGSGEVKSAMENEQPAGMAIWGIILYTTFRPKGIFEEIFEGPKYDDKAFDKGISLIRKAADMGDAAASYYMGGWCISGNIRQIIKNERDAYRYTQNSADKGYPSAMYRLGKWYVDGINGVRKNPALGNELIEKAAFYDQPAAVDYVKKLNGRWFETDFNSAEDKNAVELSRRLLSPPKKVVTNDIIFDKSVDMTFDGIVFNSDDELNQYRDERKTAENILAGCETLDDYLSAWDRMEHAQFSILDKSFYLSMIRKMVIKLSEISGEELELYRQWSLKFGYICDGKIMLSGIPTELIKTVDSGLDSNGRYFMHLGGKPLPDSDKLAMTKQAFKIPLEDDVFVIHPIGGMFWRYYTEKMIGYAVSSSGLYFKDHKKRLGAVAWEDFKNSAIYFANPLDKTIESDCLWVDDYFFLTDEPQSHLVFLKKIRSLVRLIYQLPDNSKHISVLSDAPEKVSHASIASEGRQMDTGHAIERSESSEQLRETRFEAEAVVLAGQETKEPDRKNNSEKAFEDRPKATEMLSFSEKEKPLAPATPDESKICPSCHKPNKMTAKFCSYCGEPLEEPRFCQACGTKLRPGKKFCSNCGAKIE